MKDMNNSFKCLEIGGIMWMDDYLFNEKVKETMDIWLIANHDKYKLIFKGWQLAVKKIKD